jgi:hypothetical protein
MRVRHVIATVTSSAVLVLLGGVPAHADEEPTSTPTPSITDEVTPTTPAPAREPTAVDGDATPPAVAAPVVELSAPVSQLVGLPVTVTGRVTTTDSPVRPVVLGLPDPVEVTPAADGTFSAELVVRRGTNVVTASYTAADGQVAETTAQVEGLRTTARVSFRAPSTVKDESSAAMRIAWSTSDGRKVSGKVALQYRKDGRWKTYRTVTVKGTATTKVTARSSYHWRVVAPATELTKGKTSSSRYVKNVPAGKVWSLAPKPDRKTPDQPRVSVKGADVDIDKISKARARTMRGRSWHSGCIALSKLRVVKVNYWGFDGYRHRGEIVVHKDVATRVGKIFRDMHTNRYPIYRMYPVDRFGWSKKLRGADDVKSMHAGNTSGFNCRQVVGDTAHRSPHATGRSIDVNTWWNPYHSRSGVTPNRTWAGRSSPKQVVYRSRSNPVVKIFAKHGFRWLGTIDPQHFDD